MTRATFLLVVLGSLLLCQSAAADTFIMEDGTESLFISSTNVSRVSSCINPPAEVLCFELLAPSTGLVVTATTLATAYTVADPDGVTLSDFGDNSFSIGGGSAAFTLNSDPFGSPETCVTRGGPCTFIETGSPQTLGTITWSDGTVDTIQFVSEADGVAAVPEPASMSLLLAGLGGLVFKRRRR